MATKSTDLVSRETSTESTCSKCEGSLDTSGYPRWCKKCRAANQREYQRTLKDMSETRGFAAGGSAAKDFIAKCFEAQIRGASITGFEAARYVRACNLPG